MHDLTPNTQAILLLTAPLQVGKTKASTRPLTPGEYEKFARCLRESGSEPAGLVASQASVADVADKAAIESDRVFRLLERGLLLSQAIEQWRARGIWVVSRADPIYPSRLKKRLRGKAPAILYGCGSSAILDGGGLAVVGSRKVDKAIEGFAANVGELATSAGRAVVSGGARGIDQAAMHGALDAGGRVIAVLADSLAAVALKSDYRNALLEERLVLVSPYDPNAGFSVGHAMSRNKLIYALADAALVVRSDVGKGGTWSGAIEQLQKMRFVPVYTRDVQEPGLEALRRKGAMVWLNPSTGDELQAVLSSDMSSSQSIEQLELGQVREPAPQYRATPLATDDNEVATSRAESPADVLLSTVRDLLADLDSPRSAEEIAEELRVSVSQARSWLAVLVAEGTLEKLSRPVRYRRPPLKDEQATLFE